MTSRRSPLRAVAQVLPLSLAALSALSPSAALLSARRGLGDPGRISGHRAAMTPLYSTWRELDVAWRHLVRSGAIRTQVPAGDGRQVLTGLEFRAAEIVFFARTEDEAPAFGESSAAPQSRGEGQFLVTLLPTRALRPPATPKLGELPPYDPQTDSFVTGPLRLELRQRLGQLRGLLDREWEVHFNISPGEKDGHYLLFPSLEEPQNNRAQELLRQDAQDLTLFCRAANAEAPGLNYCVNYNAPRAGASQNHIHAHAWRRPEGQRYAVEIAMERGALASWGKGYDGVEVCLSELDYPAFALHVSATNVGDDHETASVAIGSAVRDVLDMLEEQQPSLGRLTHNLCGLGGQVVLFVRRAEAEVAPDFPTLKIGSAQMCGMFQVESFDQFEAANADTIGASLQHTRPQDQEALRRCLDEWSSASAENNTR
eukprot:scaffold2326_cov286-Pinguiococcus_pyrenoidosus.AAC.12